MWIVRLLFFVLIMALLPLIVRVVSAVVMGLFGRPAPRGRACRLCGGTGWVAAGEGTRRACGCGTVPADARGPVIDVESRDRSAGGGLR